MTRILLYMLPVIIIISILGAFLVFKIDKLNKDKKITILITPIIISVLMYILAFIGDRIFYKSMTCDGAILIIMFLSIFIMGFGIYINLVNFIYKFVKKLIK